MDDTQKVVIACCLLAMMGTAGGGLFYVNHMREKDLNNAREALAVIECEQQIKRTNKYSLVLSDENVRAGLECAEKYPQFQSFKTLFDERSPNSPVRKADN